MCLNTKNFVKQERTTTNLEEPDAEDGDITHTHRCPTQTVQVSWW